MKMQRRHFEYIADTLAGLRDMDLTAWQRATLIEQFADSLEQTNPQFKRETFIRRARGDFKND